MPFFLLVSSVFDSLILHFTFVSSVGFPCAYRANEANSQRSQMFLIFVHEHEVGKMGGRSSQLHIRVLQQIFPLSFFLFPMSSRPPNFMLGFCSQFLHIFLPKCEVWKTGGQERGKGKRRKFVKICCQTQTWSWEDRPPVFPSSQLHARTLYRDPLSLRGPEYSNSFKGIPADDHINKLCMRKVGRDSVIVIEFAISMWQW